MESNLRRWQQQAIRDYEAADPTDFLLVATPGAGKTRFAGEVLRQRVSRGQVTRVFVVVPTEHLKGQWAADLSANAGIEVDPRWSNSDGALASDYQGAAVTYQQVATNPSLFRRHASSQPTAVVFDEIHHCGSEKMWGKAMLDAFGDAAYRIALSGTPFREDNRAIPFIRYGDGQALPDFYYGYGEALKDGICRCVFFPRRGGQMEWVGHGGDIKNHTFEDNVNREEANQRLRTALATSGDWLREVLSDAHHQLQETRASDPRAGGLVIAMDQEHAKWIAQHLEQVTGHAAVLAISDESDASKRIARFAKSKEMWLVSVKMVSEGVDIPRLRVGVYATNCTTELFFRQAVGRFVRVPDDNDDPTACVFIPDDERLRGYAERIKQQRDQHLDENPALDPQQLDDERPQLLSAFMPLSSTAQNAGMIIDGADYTPAEIERAESLRGLRPQYQGWQVAAVAQFLRDAAIVHERPQAAPATATTKADRKKTLRDANAGVSRRLKFSVGQEYSTVNAALNRSVGIASVSTATEEQLVRRLSIAQDWIKRGEIPNAY